MMAQQQQSAGEAGLHLPLQQELTTRDGTLTKDSFMKNCFVEAAGTVPVTVKRPGLVLFHQLPAGTGQGQFFWNGYQYAIVGDTIYRVDTRDSYAIPGVTAANQQYEAFVPTAGSYMTVGILKSVSGMWALAQAGAAITATKVTSNYPAVTVPGLVVLDSTVYVMDTSGTVRGSALNDPTTWPALNFLQMDPGLGQPVGLRRHLNYAAALMTRGTQLMYDAANGTGLPLSTVSNGNWTTGAASTWPTVPVSNTAAELTDNLIFVATTNGELGRTVILLDSGLAMKEISTPHICRVLNRSSLLGAYAYALRAAGHTFYMLAMPDINTTLAYDLAMGMWYVWSTVTRGVEGYFSARNYASNGAVDMLQDPTSGAVYTLSPSAYQDNGNSIIVQVQTVPYDWGTMRYKFLASLSLIADTVNSTLSMQYSNDDYATTSTAAPIDLSVIRKQVQRLGSTRRRSFTFTHTDNTPLRLYYAELYVRRGNQ